MKKLKSIAYKVRYIALFFFALVLNSLSACGFKTPVLYPVSYSMHLLDLGMGFCARFLPGQLYKWIMGENYAYETVKRYDMVLLLIAFLLISLLLNEFVMSAPEKSRKWYVLAALFYSLGPLTFALYSYGFGIIDTLWMIFLPLFLFALGNKYAKYAAPLIIIPMVMVHFSVLICYLVLIYFILLYKATEQKEKKGKAVWGALFAVCFIIGVGMTAYFVLFESSNVKYSAEETMRIVSERSAIGKFTDLLYVNFDVFKIITFDKMTLFEDVVFPYNNLRDDILIPAGSTPLPPFIVKIINAAWPNIHFHMTYYTGKGRLPDELVNLVAETVFLSPVIAFIMKYFVHRRKIAKEQSKKFQGFLFLLAIIYMPIVLVFWFVCSVDYFRYINHTMIVEGGFALYVMMCNKEDTSEWLEAQFKHYDKRLFIMYAALYFLMGSVVQ